MNPAISKASMAKVVATGLRINGREIFTFAPTRQYPSLAQPPYPSAGDPCPRSQFALLFLDLLIPSPDHLSLNLARAHAAVLCYPRPLHKHKYLEHRFAQPLRESITPLGDLITR